MAQDLFTKLEAQHGLPSGLLDAVWTAESSRGKNMRSTVGAQGHFQFMPATAKQYGLANPDDLNQSAAAAARMYGDLMQKYGDLPKALAAYNWGQGNVDRKGMDNAPSETRGYINKITSKMGASTMAGRDFSKELFGDEPASQPAGRDLSAELFGDDKPSKKDRADSFLKTAVAPATNYSGKDAVGGMVRGSGSIGTTLLTPFDALANSMGVKNDFIGRDDRRTGMDAGLNTLGVNTDSTAFKTNKLGAEIAGTAGVGGVISNTLGRVLPASVQALPVAQKFIQAVQSGGMTLGGAPAKTLMGKAGEVAIRSAGGAVTGGASAGLVDPENAKTGAVAGALLPIGAVGLGKAGELIGQRAKQKAEAALLDFNRNAPKNQTLKDAIDAGYVVPPNMVKPSFKNQTIESISGKQATQQLFSEKNEKVTGSLVRKSLGIPDDAPLTQSALENLRKTAGKAYADVSALSKQAADDLEALKVARNEAQAWFKHYNTTAHPDSLAKAKELRALSDSLETALEQHAATAGKTSLIPALREARKQIAKTYTVGRALNDAAGTVDARILGRMHEKGLPLSDGLDVAGKFASAFKTVAKSSPEVGSAGAHNMKAITSGVMTLGGAATAGPVGVVAGLVPFIAPPVARAAMLRNGVQKGLVAQAPKASDSALAKILMDQELQRLLGITAPVAISRSGP